MLVLLSLNHLGIALLIMGALFAFSIYIGWKSLLKEHSKVYLTAEIENDYPLRKPYS